MTCHHVTTPRSAPAGNINFDLSPRDVVGPSHETNASMNSLLSQLQSLHLKVDKKTKPSIVINTADLSSFINDYY